MLRYIKLNIVRPFSDAQGPIFERECVYLDVLVTVHLFNSIQYFTRSDYMHTSTSLYLYLYFPFFFFSLFSIGVDRDNSSTPATILKQTFASSICINVYIHIRLLRMLLGPHMYF